MEDVDLLGRLGMTKSESVLYSTLLRFGPMTAGKMVTLSKLHISVAYAAVHRLVGKGYIKYIKKGRFNEYSVTKPEIFRDEVKETLVDLKKKMVEWKRYAAYSEMRTSVEVFEGMKGISNLINGLINTLKRGDYYRSFAFGEENFINAEVLNFFKKINEKRVKIGLKTRLICNKRYKDFMYRVGDPRHLSTSNLRFVSFDFPQGIAIVKDNVIFFSWSETEEPKGIHIINAKLASQYADFFDNLYKKGEPYRKSR